MAINSISPATQQAQPFNPVQNLAQLADINGTNANTAKTQAETANEPIKGQLMQSQAALAQLQQRAAQADMDDQQQIKNWMTDPANSEALKSGDLSGLAGKVQPRNYMGLQKTLVEGQEAAAKLSKAQLDLNNERHTQVGSFIDGLKLLPEDQRPAAYQAGIASLNQQGLLKGINAPSTITGADDELNNLAALNNVYTGIYSKAQQRQKEQADIGKTTTETAKAAAETPGLQAKSDIEVAQANAMKNAKPEEWDAKVDLVVPNTGDSAQLNARTKAQVKSIIASGGTMKDAQAVIKDASDQLGRTETAVRTASATAPTKVNVYTQEQSARNAAQTPDKDALDFMAEKVLAGENPPTRSPVQAAAVYKRAAELAASRGMDASQAVMESHAAKANTQALGAVNKQYETLKPFAEMAEKNADVLEKAMKGVEDLGAPILNTPIRNLEAQFGGAKTAAFKAAILPVQADFARILSSPTGGGQLTDSARKEMESAISPGATPSQLKAALDVFRNDAANRKASYEASIADLTKRSVSGGLPPPPPPPPRGQAPSGSITVKAPNGSQYYFKDQASADQFKKAAGIQ